MLMATTLPLQMIFYRVPVTDPGTPIQDTPSSKRQGAASTAAAELAAASDPIPEPPNPQLAAILGCVSTADIAGAAKAVLAQSVEGAQVVLGAEDITIKGEGSEAAGIEGDTLKALGDFPVELRVKGGEPVHRVVSVKLQEASL